MKLVTLLLFFGLALPVVADDITTLTGRTYTNANVSRIDVDGITVLFTGGGSKIAFTNLPPEIQKKYGFDPEKAAAVAAKQDKIKKLGRLGMVYRLSELEDAKTEAKQKGQPLAFLATEVQCIQSNADPRRKGSSAATIHEFETLRRVAVIVFSDCRTENHTEPSIVDAALHPPEDVHYTPPKVVVTDAEVTKVIAVVPFQTDPAERQKLLNAAAAAIREAQKKLPTPEKP